MTGKKSIQAALELLLPDEIPALAPDVEQCIYRIAQEAIENVVYHANAFRLVVHLRADERGVALTVDDDGIGA
jgi:signal transduction histidine kinase